MWNNTGYKPDLYPVLFTLIMLFNVGNTTIVLGPDCHKLYGFGKNLVFGNFFKKEVGVCMEISAFKRTFCIS